jgi:hypothetical protein
MTQHEDDEVDRSNPRNVKSSEAYVADFYALRAVLFGKDKEWLASELADRITREEIKREIDEAYRPGLEASKARAEMLRTVLEKQNVERIETLEKLLAQHVDEISRLRIAISKAQKTRSIKPLAAVTERRRAGRPSIDLRGAQLIVESASAHVEKSSSIRAGIIDWINSHPASDRLNLDRQRDREQVAQMVEFYRTCVRRIKRG